MKARSIRRCATIMLSLVLLSGCRRAPTPMPGDPLLDAIRADEREGNLSYAESQGKRLFAQYCATCHGDAAKGDGQNASNLNPPPPDMTIPRAGRDAPYIRKVIAEGSAAIGRSPLSPPWGRSLSPQQIDYLVAYCESFSRVKH